MANNDNEQLLRKRNEILLWNILNDPFYQVEKTILQNGLTVIFNKNKLGPYARMVVYVKTGAINEPKGKKGLVHLYEHLAFLTGNKSNKIVQEVLVGAPFIQAHTAYDYTSYAAEVLHANLPKAIELQASLLGSIGSNITQQEIDNEVEVVREEMISRSPDDYLMPHLVRKTLFRKSHRLWTDVGGNYKDLSSVTPADIVDFEKYYNPKNIIVVISGNFEANEIFSLTNKHFGRKENYDNEVNETNSRIYRNEHQHFYHINDTVHEKFLMCNNLFGEYSNDWIATRAALCYSCNYGVLSKGFILSSSINEGFFFFQLDGENPANAYERYIQSVESVSHESITGSQLYEIQNKVLACPSFNGNGLAKSLLLAKLDLIFGEPSIQKVTEKIISLTPKDICYAVENYLAPERLKTLHIVKSSYINPGLPGAKRILEERPWFSLVPKARFGAPSPAEQLPVINKIPETCNDYPSSWRFRLSNGVRVFGSTIKESEVIMGTVLIRVGSQAEKKGFSRINNFCAKAMKGTEQLPPKKFRKQVQLLDSDIDITIQYERIEIDFVSSRKNIKSLFRLIEEAILTPYITEDLIENTKEDLDIDLIYHQLAQTSARAINLFSQLALGGDQPFFRNKLGFYEDEKNISVTSVKEHFFNCIKPNITDICLTGNITKELCREVLTSLENKWKGEYINKSTPVKSKPNPAPKERIYVTRPLISHKNVHILFIKMIPPENTKEFYIVRLLNGLLGGRGMSSYLFRNLRDKRGVTRQARSFVRQYGGMSFFIAEVKTDINSVAKVFRIMHDTIFGYADIFSEEMFKYILHKTIVENNLSIKSEELELDNLKGRVLHALNYNLKRWENKILSNITFSEMKEVAANFFSPSEFYFIVDGDYEKGIMDSLIRLKYGKPIEVIPDTNETIDALYEWDLDENSQSKEINHIISRLKLDSVSN